MEFNVLTSDGNGPESIADVREDMPTQELIAWVLERFADRRTFATTAFGMEGCALVHMLASTGRSISVVYVDTGFFFPETYELRDRIQEKYPNVRLLRVAATLTPEEQARRHGPELWKKSPDLCCRLRKVEPIRPMMQGADLWIAGIRAGQAPTRAHIRILEWDWKYLLLKFNPLAKWTRQQVWEYVRQHDVPYNVLHERGYPSIGCTHCTRPVGNAGVADYSRDGRWSGMGKIECGLQGYEAVSGPSPSTPGARTMIEEPVNGNKTSKIEGIKHASRFLRGAIAETLASEATHFSADDTHVLKPHGTYQQDDRDVRNDRRRAGLEADFTFMVRVGIPGGVLAAEQYLALDELAGLHGSGTLRLTTRQGVQFHGVRKPHLRESIAHINEKLMTTLGACGDVHRNILACPAPLADAAHEVVRPVVLDIARQLRPATRAYHEIWLGGEKLHGGEPEEPFYGEQYLPRKFKTGVALNTDNCTDVYSYDCGLIAIVREGRLTGFNVVVGGGMGMTHHAGETFAKLAEPLAFVDVEHAAETVKAVAAVYRDHGNRADRKRARLKYLIAEWGLDAFRSAVAERVRFELQPDEPLARIPFHDHLGRQLQSDGRWFYGVHVPSGRIADHDGVRLRAGLREIVDRLTPAVHLTPGQNLLLVGLAERDLDVVEQVLGEHGVERAEALSGVRRFALACPALPTCGLALTEAERAAPHVLSALESELIALGLEDEPLVLRLTGCPNGCARPYTADIAFVGRKPKRYNVYVGGGPFADRVADLYLEDLALNEAIDGVRPLLQAWAMQRREEESFGDFYQRLAGNLSPRRQINGDEQPTHGRIDFMVAS